MPTAEPPPAKLQQLMAPAALGLATMMAAAASAAATDPPLLAALFFAATAVSISRILTLRGHRHEDEAYSGWLFLVAGLLLQALALVSATSVGNSLPPWPRDLVAAPPVPPLTLAFYLAAAALSRRRVRSGASGLDWSEIGLITLAVWVVRNLAAAEIESMAAVSEWAPAVAASLRSVVDAGALLLFRADWRRTPGPQARRALVLMQTAVLANALAQGAPWGAPAPPWAVLMAGSLVVALLVGWAALAAPAPAAAPKPLVFDAGKTEKALGIQLAGGAIAVLAALRIEASLLLAPAPSRPGVAVAVLLFLGLLWGRLHKRLLAGQSALDVTMRSEARLRSMLDSINDAVVTEDVDGNLLFANQQYYRVFGLRPGADRGTRLERLIHPDDHERFRSDIRNCVESRKPPERSDFRGLRSDGSVIDLECTVSSMEAGGIRLGIQAVLRDVSRHRLIETSQRAMAQRLEFFFSEMPLGCIIWDLDFGVQEWNDSAERIFGWSSSEALNRRYVDFLATAESSDEIEQQWARLRRGKTTSHHVCETHTKGRGKIECEWFHTSLVDDSRQVVAVASMVQDITERTTLERQLLQSQKLEAVGTLAGGIAHDFNNLLTIILGQITLAIMKLGPGDAVVKGLRDAERAAERAAELTRKVLRFSRARASQLQPANLNECVREVVGILQHSIDRQITLDTSLDSHLWMVEADAGEIEQVIMNLCVNARDAITERGSIRIRSANRIFGSGDRRDHRSARPGDFVEIAVVDDGCGIDEETQRRVFDPFFTTKEVGKGTGLGLATVYGIVEAHRGWVELESRLGAGSEFRIYIPRTRRSLAKVLRPADPELRPGKATILWADDEASVRALARETLERQGHIVIEAGDGAEAISVYEQNRERIGLIVLDLTMPNMSGWEALDHLRALKVTVPIIVSSGYALESGPRSRRDAGVAAFLAKPYKAQDLLAVVQEVLALPPAPEASSTGVIETPAPGR